MTETPFEGLASLDRQIHEPARLAVMAALSACEHADFLYLQQITGLTKGNLSSHLSKLENAGFIRIDKTFVKKTPRTRARLTDEGRRAMDEYWRIFDGARRGAVQWRSDGK
ncbi:MAG: winged helix-turn-helix domain-containing protein [Parvularculaceae bacterium]